MKLHQYLCLVAVAIACTGCFTTLFTTTVPVTKPAPAPVVVMPVTPAPVVVKPTYPYAKSLDLKAIAAAFIQSESVQEFEYLINHRSYYLSNLDLNGDGFVDYLRVLETVSGYAHVYYIQAVLGANYFQDVATLTAEVPMSGTCYVQVIGAPYLYGPNYIIQPVIVRTPVIYTALRRNYYTPWRSPYYWNHYPACYIQRAPQYETHYVGYVDVYMKNHRYCREVTVCNQPHYVNYATVGASDRRDDHQTGSTSRPAGNNVTVHTSSPTTTTTTTTRNSSSSASSSRTSSSASSSSSRTSSSSSSTPTTTVTTRVSNNTGRATQTVTRTTDNGMTTTTTTRSTGSRNSGSTTTRTTTSTPARTSSSASTSSSRTSSSASTSASSTRSSSHR